MLLRFLLLGGIDIEEFWLMDISISIRREQRDEFFLFYCGFEIGLAGYIENMLVGLDMLGGERFWI